MTNGKLIVACSHIGNSKDITLNTVDHIGNAKNIVVENEQRFFALCNDLSIKLQENVNIKEIKFYDYEGNIINLEHEQLKSVIDILKSGEDVLLISDEGSPGISDPGINIINECINESIEVSYLPGANSVIPAFILSGFTNPGFVYLGFMLSNRRETLKKFKDGLQTVILHSSPDMCIDILNDINHIYGSQKIISISVNMSKEDQVIFRGTVSDMLQKANEGLLNRHHTIAIKGII